MFRIEHPAYLILLLLIPLLVLLYFLISMNRKRALKRFGDIDVIAKLMPAVSIVRPAFKFGFLILALVFLIIALANPQIGSKVEKVKRSGVDLIIALDVSNSMLAEDIKPNRLERAKQAIMKLIDKLDEDRIGVVVFAGKAYTQLPITSDYGAAKLFVSTVNTTLIPVQGTSIGAAIELAGNSFDFTKAGKNKAIIIITDGENHEDDAIVAAKNQAKKGVFVHTLGMGLPDGAPIPIYEDGKLTGYKKDQEQKTVITKLNETMLQQIAAAGNGIYVRANNTEIGLNVIMKEIEKMEKKDFESKLFSNYQDHFFYFLQLALLLLIIELLLYEKKSRILSKVNLFGQKKTT
jgi:Ca-activated chloride channel family protein